MKTLLSKPFAISVLSLVFGLMLGLGLSSSIAHAESPDHQKHERCEKRGFHRPHPPRSEDMSGVLSMLERKIDLTDEQKSSINQVINQYNPELTALMEQMRESKKAEWKLMKQDDFDEAAIQKSAKEQAQLLEKVIVLKSKAKHAIHSRLTAEQKAELEKMFEKHHHDEEEGGEV